MYLNVEAPLLLTRWVLPGMLERGRGKVVTMASIAGLAGTPYGAVYSATKAAVVAATSSLRQEHPDSGVGFTARCPGFVHGAGMHEVHRQEVGKAPLLVGGTSLDAVCRALIRALHTDRPRSSSTAVPCVPSSGCAAPSPAWATPWCAGSAAGTCGPSPTPAEAEAAARGDPAGSSRPTHLGDWPQPAAAL